jgi:arylsulfatase A-like enzyme
VTRPGAVSDQPVAFWDVLPTAAEIGGGTAPAGLDGASFVPALRGRPDGGERVFYWEFHEGGFNRALRFGDWKAIQFGKDGPIELHDLRNDPGERTDVAAGNPKVIAAAREHFSRQRRDDPYFPVQPGPARSPDRGYVIK